MLGVLESRLKPGSMMSNSSVSDGGTTQARRILAIDDDSAVQRVLKRLFEPEGYRVDSAKDGMSGLELFRKWMPSAVVLDLLLPDISGQEICQQVITVAPRVPVIVLSAKADLVDKVALLK